MTPKNVLKAASMLNSRDALLRLIAAEGISSKNPRAEISLLDCFQDVPRSLHYSVPLVVFQDAARKAVNTIEADLKKMGVKLPGDDDD